MHHQLPSEGDRIAASAPSYIGMHVTSGCELGVGDGVSNRSMFLTISPRIDARVMREMNSGVAIALDSNWVTECGLKARWLCMLLCIRVDLWSEGELGFVCDS